MKIINLDHPIPTATGDVTQLKPRRANTGDLQAAAHLLGLMSSSQLEAIKALLEGQMDDAPDIYGFFLSALGNIDLTDQIFQIVAGLVNLEGDDLKKLDLEDLPKLADMMTDFFTLLKSLLNRMQLPE